MALTVATWNVNGIRARQAQFLEWLERDRPDVVCLQEIKATPAQLADELCNLNGYWCYWHGAGAYSGVSLHLRHETFPDKPQFEHPAFDYETRIVTAGMGDVTFVSIYVPNGGKDFAAKMDFLRGLRTYAAAMRDAGRRLILCGDMNVARTDQDVHPKERKPNAIGQLPVERDLIERILGRGLVDLGRALDPANDGLFTWWAPWRNLRQRNIGWRLDYVLASESLAARAISCPSFREIGTSDHAPVMMSTA